MEERKIQVLPSKLKETTDCVQANNLLDFPTCVNATLQIWCPTTGPVLRRDPSSVPGGVGALRAETQGESSKYSERCSRWVRESSTFHKEALPGDTAPGSKQNQDTAGSPLTLLSSG